MFMKTGRKFTGRKRHLQTYGAPKLQNGKLGKLYPNDYGGGVLIGGATKLMLKKRRSWWEKLLAAINCDGFCDCQDVYIDYTEKKIKKYTRCDACGRRIARSITQ